MKLLGYIRTAGFKANIVIVPEGGADMKLMMRTGAES